MNDLVTLYHLREYIYVLDSSKTVTALLQTVIRQQAEQREQFRVVTAMVQELLRRSKSTEMGRKGGGSLPENISFPIAEYITLANLDKELATQEIFDSVVSCVLFL